MIGDPVNVAARVQKATREIGEPVLVTEATRCLPSAPPTASPARHDRAKGKPRPDRGLRAARAGPVTMPGRRSVEREAHARL